MNRLGLVLVLTGIIVACVAGYFSAVLGQPMLAVIVTPAILLVAYGPQIGQKYGR